MEQRLVPNYEAWSQDLDKLKSRLQGLEESDPKMFKRIMDQMEGARSTVAVLEFVPGAGLDEAKDTLTMPSRDLMYELGKICALDTLLNNFDRVPIPIWENKGNLSNVIVMPGGERTGCTVAIDQQVYPIDEGA